MLSSELLFMKRTWRSALGYVSLILAIADLAFSEDRAPM